MRSLPTFALAACLIPASTASAAGFYISDVGALGMSRGGAFVAAPDSLTAINYNPAALTLLGKGLHFQIDFQLVNFSMEFTRTCPCVSPSADGVAFPTAADAVMLDADLARTFGKVENIADPQPIPTLWVAYGFDWHKLTIGAGAWALTSPGRTKFGEAATAARQPQRYSLIELKLFELFVVGAAAIEPIEGLRVGLAVGGYQFNVTQVSSLWANTNLTSMPENSALDIATTLSFSAPIRMMWNAGISYTPTFLPRLSIGASALSKRSVRAPGTVDVIAPQLLTDTGGGITGNKVEVEVNLPPTFRVGAQWDEPGTFELEAAVVIEGWQVYKEVTIRPQDVVVTTGNISEPLPTIHFETAFETTYSLRVGGELKIWEPYVGIHGGYFFEPSATPIEIFDISSPDLDKHGITFGLGTEWSGIRLELAGAIVIMPEQIVTNSRRKMVAPLAPPQGDLTLVTTIGNGTYSGSYFIFGASVGVAIDPLLAAFTGDEPQVAPPPEKGLASPGGEG